MSMTAQMVLIVDDDPNDAFFIESAFKKAHLSLAVKHFKNSISRTDNGPGVMAFINH